MTASRALARNEDWGQLGPAMRALPNNKHRAFVEFYLLEKPGHGAQTNAARRAGFGHAKTTPLNMARIASRLMRDERIIAAIAEEARKLLRGGAPEAVKALQNLVRNPEHKDHARGISMVLARTDPEVQQHDLHISHRIIDADQEALEELRAARALGATREKLLELFGGNYLPRLERLEAAEQERQAAGAKIIDGEAIEIEQRGAA
jgi:phage terminase small subunit